MIIGVSRSAVQIFQLFQNTMKLACTKPTKTQFNSIEIFCGSSSCESGTAQLSQNLYPRPSYIHKLWEREKQILCGNRHFNICTEFAEPELAYRTCNVTPRLMKRCLCLVLVVNLGTAEVVLAGCLKEQLFSINIDHCWFHSSPLGAEHAC